MSDIDRERELAMENDPTLADILGDERIDDPPERPWDGDGS